MTTDVYVRRADDVFAENDVLNVRPVDTHRAVALAAVTWCVTDMSARGAHMAAAKCAIDTISEKLANYTVYLLAGHTAPQRDTRIVRYRKLWSSLSVRGLPIAGEDLGESIVPAGDGLRCFGLRRLGEGDVESAVAVLEEERASLVVAIPEQDDAILRQAVEIGWPPPEQHPGTELLIDVARAGGIVLWTIGGFDDREAGFAAVALPEVVNELMS